MWICGSIYAVDGLLTDDSPALFAIGPFATFELSVKDSGTAGVSKESEFNPPSFAPNPGAMFGLKVKVSAMSGVLEVVVSRLTLKKLGSLPRVFLFSNDEPASGRNCLARLGSSGLSNPSVSIEKEKPAIRTASKYMTERDLVRFEQNIVTNEESGNDNQFVYSSSYLVIKRTKPPGFDLEPLHQLSVYLAHTVR